jgi:hypothetical protein
MVDTPSMLKARLLLSGVKETSNVVALILLFTIHVASDLDPITRIASADCMREKEMRVMIRKTEDKEERSTSRVRLGGEYRIVLESQVTQAISGYK